MGREIRKVPANWEHPRKQNGEYQPMFDQYYGDALAELEENNRKWEDGTHPDLLERPELKQRYPKYELWSGEAPDPLYYNPNKYSPEELTHIQLYENTTEGTPQSPVFKAEEFEQLCEYASKYCTTFADYKASKDDWMGMLSNGRVHHKEGNIIFI